MDSFPSKKTLSRLVVDRPIPNGSNRSQRRSTNGKFSTKILILKISSVPEPPPPPPVKEVVDQCERRPGKVKNGVYKNCEEKDGKVMCRLQCKAGHIPDGKAKWACKNGVVTSPATGCVKLQVPERQADCQTPTVNNGQYICNWSVACIDESLGKACVRKCKLKCDAGIFRKNFPKSY